MSSSTDTEAGSESGPAFVAPGPLPDGTALWLIRHGETEWSKSGRHTSHTDVPLTRHGEAQALGLGGLVRSVQPAYVLCSPRQRARHTADLAGLTVDAIDADLAEWDYGDYEGLTTAQIRKQVPGWSLWTHPLPGGEAAADVSARADRVLIRALDRPARARRRAFRARHGSAVRARRGARRGGHRALERAESRGGNVSRDVTTRRASTTAR